MTTKNIKTEFVSEIEIIKNIGSAALDLCREENLSCIVIVTGKSGYHACTSMDKIEQLGCIEMHKHHLLSNDQNLSVTNL